MLRGLSSLLIAAGLSLIAVTAQTQAPCAPVSTPTCSPSGVPIAPPSTNPPAPTNPVPTNPPGSTEAPTINAVTGTIVLGGGRDVRGAQGMALDPNTGLVYIGLNGNIVAGCDGDVTRSGPAPQRPGAHQMSIVDPSAARELTAVPTGMGPIWPTVDPARRVVYMAGSGSGKVTVHDLTSGDTLSSITVGGLPHAGGLDYTTRLMVVGNTVRTGPSVADQNHSSVIDTATGRVVREFETSPAPHGMVVDQDRHLTYFTAVGDGAIVVVNAVTGQVVFTGVPKAKYGTAAGNNNLLARQAATRRLFQVNAQPAATGLLVVDEVTLTSESVIAFGTTRYIPWGMWVDEPNRLLFAALPNANAIGVVDLDSLTHVGMIPVGSCPYAVVVDPERRIGVTSNQGTPSENASASVFDLCSVYAATGRPTAACTAAGRQR